MNEQTIVVFGRIAGRYEAFCDAQDLDADSRLDTMIDLEAASRAFPDMRWRELLEADDANFLHDVFGIKRSIDRTAVSFASDETLTAEQLFPDHFVPRYA